MNDFAVGFVVGCWFMVGVAYLKYWTLKRRYR
jgi:hypothetical protein